jgi:hypothetical protein
MMGPRRKLAMDYPKCLDKSWKPLYFLMLIMHKTTRLISHSITGIIVFVGSTLVLWPSKCQGCIAMSTYTAEFVVMWSTIDEAILIWYMFMHCSGIPG